MPSSSWCPHRAACRLGLPYGFHSNESLHQLVCCRQALGENPRSVLIIDESEIEPGPFNEPPCARLVGRACIDDDGAVSKLLDRNPVGDFHRSGTGGDLFAGHSDLTFDGTRRTADDHLARFLAPFSVEVVMCDKSKCGIRIRDIRIHDLYVGVGNVHNY